MADDEPVTVSLLPGRTRMLLSDAYMDGGLAGWPAIQAHEGGGSQQCDQAAGQERRPPAESVGEQGEYGRGERGAQWQARLADTHREAPS